MNQKQLGVLVAMSTGVFAGVASIAKTATLSAIANPDVQALVALMPIATVETTLTIVVASIPMLRVFTQNTIRHLSARHFGHYHSPPSPAVDARHITSPAPVQTRSGKDNKPRSHVSSGCRHGSSMDEPFPVPIGRLGNCWVFAPGVTPRPCSAREESDCIRQVSG